MQVKAVDLFCGAGGLSCGLAQAGIDVVAGVDIDPASQYPFEANNNAEYVLKNVADLKPSEVKKFYSNADISLLAGCAPCQPFSTYSQGARGAQDDKWSLLLEFQRLVKSVKPDIVTMENVPKIRSHSVFLQFVKSLERLQYHVHHEIVDCQRYGLPQQRRRLVLLASRLGPIKLLSPSKRYKLNTVRSALNGLPVLRAGQVSTRDSLHRSASLSELNSQRIRASVPGGTWRDWPKKLVADCHKKVSGNTYPAVYGRMRWDEPSPTITTQFFGYGNGRFGHPTQHRALSLREGALLQGFPKTYKFVPKDKDPEFTTVGRLIGNAVPVPLGRLIGKSIARHVREYG